MTWTYNAGTTTPGYGGLAELPSLRFNDGTFKPSFVPPLVQSAPLRVPSAPVPRGGGSVGDALLDVWAFDLQGWFDAIVGDDVQAVTDYLLSKVNAALGDMTLTLKGRGWSTSRTMTVRLNGQVTVDEPDIQGKKLETRIVTIPLIAVDPRRYGASVSTTIATSATSVTNSGNMPSPFTVRFNGPLTDPEVNGPGVGNIIAVTGTIASGDWVEVTTVDATTGTLTAVDSTGADAFGVVATDSADYLYPGVSSWTKSGGTGVVTISARPAW